MHQVGTDRTAVLRRAGRWALRATGPVVLLFLLLRVVDYRELKDVVTGLHIAWAAAAVGAMQVVVLFRTLRWIEIHRAFKLPRAPLTYQLRLTYATTLATLVLPQILNPFSRLVLLIQDGYRAQRAGVAVVSEKLLDFFSFLVFGLFGSIVLASVFGALVWWLLAAAAMGAAAGLAGFAARSHLRDLLTSLIVRIPGIPDTAASDASRLLEEMVSLSPAVIARVGAWSLATALAQATMLYLLSEALGIGLSYAFVVGLWGVVALTMLLPLSINGVGTREGVFVVAFTAVDRSADAAVALGLLLLAVVAIGSSPGAIEWLRRFVTGGGAGPEETPELATPEASSSSGALSAPGGDPGKEGRGARSGNTPRS